MFQRTSLRKLTKIFVTLSRFEPLRGSGVWSWVNPLKKENLQNLFQIMLNEVPKSCEK